jgi:hypothetical protein
MGREQRVQQRWGLDVDQVLNGDPPLERDEGLGGAR